MVKIHKRTNMDRRQQKTQQAIFKALSELLQEKAYAAITISEIIDRANIGRSTLYAHFESKDAVIQALCGSIFEALFHANTAKQMQGGHLQQRIIEIFQHMKMHEHIVRGILQSEGEKIFLHLFQEYLFALFTEYHILLPQQVPQEYGKHHFAQSFCTAIAWWLIKAPEQSAENMADYFMTLLQLKQRGIALSLI